MLKCLHCSGSNSYLFVSGIKIYQLKAKDSELNAYQLYLGNILKNFTVDNMKKTGLYRYVNDVSVDYSSIDNHDILGVHKVSFNQ